MESTLQNVCKKITELNLKNAQIDSEINSILSQLEQKEQSEESFAELEMK